MPLIWFKMKLELELKVELFKERNKMITSKDVS